MESPKNQKSPDEPEPKKVYKKPTVKKYDRLYEPGLGTQLFRVLKNVYLFQKEEDVENSKSHESSKRSEAKKVYKKPTVKKYDRLYQPGLGY